MARAGSRHGEGRAALSALALIALIFQLAVPPGFMVASAAAGPAIVICTGHGPFLAQVDPRGAPAPAPKGKPAPMCPFAGHGATPVASAPLGVAPVRFESFAAPAARFSAVTPGHGLAAPPPPSQAPPTHLI
ncbi:MAG TPA: hypothetical protein VN805_18350 [Caulobacteraceae bacterium]|nr:hypothetical protein [Caulobacteraceae bacterium]